MLYRMEKLFGMSIGATDGEIGKVKDVFFDDRHWGARYLVVDTGGWLLDRRVLVSPYSVKGIDWDLRVVRTTLTRQQIKDSPPIDSDQPVSRQHEIEFYGYYGYPAYWSGPLLWGDLPYPLLPPAAVLPETTVPGHVEEQAAAGDPHLQSAREVTGYHLQANDAAIGHVEDFLMDGEAWAIRYIVVNTRNWLPGKHVVIPPPWIRRVEWPEHVVEVDVGSEAVRSAPEFDPEMEFSREQEQKLHRHYRRAGYWE
jgi:sporulation protein YlmC with PRC-barrel domain